MQDGLHGEFLSATAMRRWLAAMPISAHNEPPGHWKSQARDDSGQ